MPCCRAKAAAERPLRSNAARIWHRFSGEVRVRVTVRDMVGFMPPVFTSESALRIGGRPLTAYKRKDALTIFLRLLATGFRLLELPARAGFAKGRTMLAILQPAMSFYWCW